MDSLDDFDFSMDVANLYREESFSDLNSATIKEMVPVRVDGSVDETRGRIYLGMTQVMTPGGPIPIQCRIQAQTLAEAIARLPEDIKAAVRELIAEAEEIQRQDATRIFMPGVDDKIIT